MEAEIIDAVLTENLIERVIIVLLAGAVIALYRRANHLAEQRVSDIRTAITTTNAAMAETTRALDLLAMRLERRGQAHRPHHPRSERRGARGGAAGIRAPPGGAPRQSRRQRRVIQKLHAEDRRREQK